MSKQVKDLDEFVKSINNNKKTAAKGFKSLNNQSTNSTNIEEESVTLKVTESLDENVSTPEKIEIEPTLNSDIKAVVNSLISPIINELDETKLALRDVQTNLDSTKEELTKTQNELNQTQTELESARKDSNVLKSLQNFVGTSKAGQPQPLQVLGEGSEELRTYEKLLKNTTTKGVSTNSFGYVLQKDLREADRYWKNNYSNISLGVEAILKDKGLLTGGRATNTITQITDIPSVAFDHLSAFIRMNTYEDLIHWQFCNEAIVDATEPGLNTSVPRYPYFNRPTSIASRQLNETTPIASGSDSVAQKNVKITIEELGLGKDVNNLPIGLTAFVSAFSMHDLEQVIADNIGMDYHAYNDLRLWSLWFTANNIVYPGFTGNVITNPASLTANDGIFTKEFFIYLRSYMKIRKIKPLANGYYGYTFNPGGFAQFLASLSTSERYVAEDATNKVSKVLKSVENGGEVSGFKMFWNGFAMFEQNVYGVGATPGTDAGVTNITVAGTATTFDTSFAFGADTIAKATSLPMEIRESEINDYNRRKNFIWYSHEGYAGLDINQDATSGSELRVIQVRNKRT